MKPFVSFSIVVGLLLIVSGCGGGAGASRLPEAKTAGWEPAPAAPLSGREGALAIWTGDETLVLGGSDARPCPAFADCVTPKTPPLRDGAAFEPEGRSWRQVADAPAGFSNAEGATLDGTVYVWAHGESGRPGAAKAFLAYRIADDSWARLPNPPGSSYRSIVATGDRIIAFSLSDEGGVARDFSYNPKTRGWSPLPADPLPPSFDRTMAWSGNELVLFGKRIVRMPGAYEPSLALAAALEPETGRWRRLPHSPSQDQYVTDRRWFEVDGKLINPAPGASNGPPGDSWGRSYRDGGILDPARRQWLELPPVPTRDERSLGSYGAGMVAGKDSQYFYFRGWLLDARSGDVAGMKWIKIPSSGPNRDDIDNVAVGPAGEAMLVFGGVRYRPDGSGRLLEEAWTWLPEGDASDPIRPSY